MPTAADSRDERMELESVLASGVFARAPTLAQLLMYVCDKYFEGAVGDIKEYNIAVEALGRAPDFNQKKDSIVRVEAHRLRKRLQEYYRNAGASHAIRIEIPPGQYAPRFVRYPPVALANPEAAAVALPARPASRLIDTGADGTTDSRSLTRIAEPNAASSALALHRFNAEPKRVLWTGIIAALVLCSLATMGWQVWRISTPRQDSNSRTELPGPPSDTIRFVAGLSNGSYSDVFGNLWQADRFFEGGTAVATADQRVLGTRDPRLFGSRREGSFRYDIPLRPGAYELRLYFAETFFGDSNMAGGGETSRIFTVLANGKPLLQDFDIAADAGVNTADVKVFKDVRPASDGMLHLRFIPSVSNPMINAVEITPGVPGKMRPIRMIARDRSYTDKDGNFWQPDRAARGGQLVTRMQLVANAPDPELYRGERFGNINYQIPVANGPYSVIFHFAETWFGPGKPGGGGAGSRLFDVLCNGTALVRGLDLYKEAGGSDRSLVLAFHGIAPNPQGKLNISLIPIRNYACVNGIEIIDESK